MDIDNLSKHNSIYNIEADMIKVDKNLDKLMLNTMTVFSFNLFENKEDKSKNRVSDPALIKIQKFSIAKELTKLKHSGLIITKSIIAPKPYKSKQNKTLSPKAQQHQNLPPTRSLTKRSLNLKTVVR